MDETHPTAPVRHGDLAAAAQCVGSDFQVLGTPGETDTLVLDGSYKLLRLRSGLVLHASDAVELHDLVTRVVHQAGLTISIFLHGRVRVRQGDAVHEIGTSAEGGLPCAYLFNRTRADIFERRSQRGTHVRKVNVTVSPEWVETAMGDLSDRPSLQHFLKDHGSRAAWTASPRLIGLAEQVLHPEGLDPALQQLYLESRAIEIVFEALSTLGRDEAGAPAALRSSDQRRIARALQIVEAHRGEELSLEAVAREVGASISTLQRLFHAAFGTSMFEHIRNLRLRRAREALEKEGVSVAEAAYLAGYRSPANFATAFKRLYGMSPKDARGRGL